MNIHSYYGNLLSFNEILLLGMSNYFLSNRSKEIICLQKETENSSKTSNRACFSQGNCVIYLAHEWSTQSIISMNLYIKFRHQISLLADSVLQWLFN